jgi:hypothetical protein
LIALRFDVAILRPHISHRAIVIGAIGRQANDAHRWAGGAGLEPLVRQAVERLRKQK